MREEAVPGLPWQWGCGWHRRGPAAARVAHLFPAAAGGFGVPWRVTGGPGPPGASPYWGKAMPIRCGCFLCIMDLFYFADFFFSRRNSVLGEQRVLCLVALGLCPAASWSCCKGSPGQEMSSAAIGGCRSDQKKICELGFFSLKTNGASCCCLRSRLGQVGANLWLCHDKCHHPL